MTINQSQTAEQTSTNEQPPSSLPHVLITSSFSSFTQFTPNPRPWHMPLMAGLAISFPVFVGAYFDDVAMGLLSSLGAMVVLNLPYVGSLLHRMTAVLACSFAMVACFSVGLIAHTLPMLTIPLLWFITFWVTLFSRYYRLLPPAGLFIIMAAAIALFMPASFEQIPLLIGVVALGALFAGMVACGYSLILLWQTPAKPTHDVALPSDILGDSLIFSLFVALSLGIALIFDMPKPYWVPMSCYVVIQGMNFQSIWTKHVHRILGTAIGMAVAWGLLIVHPQGYGVALAILAMMFCIETLVVRHYGLAVIFITPLTIFLAEYSTPNPSPIAEIVAARLWDTVLGCFIGVLGGLVILSPTIKAKLQIGVDKILAKIEV